MTARKFAAIGTRTKPPAEYRSTGVASPFAAQHANYAFQALEHQAFLKICNASGAFKQPTACDNADPIVACSTSQVLRLGVADTSAALLPGSNGAQLSVTATDMADGTIRAAFVPGVDRAFVVGEDGTARQSQYTDDQGTTWSTVQAITGATSSDFAKTLIYNEFTDQLVLSMAQAAESTSLVSLKIFTRSTGNSSAWSLVSTISTNRDRHMAAGPDRLCLVVCARTSPSLIAYRSVDNGVTWSGLVINETAASDNCRPVGLVWDDTHSKFVALVVGLTDNALRCYSSPDAIAWTLESEGIGYGEVETRAGNDEEKLAYHRGVLFAVSGGIGTGALRPPAQLLASYDGGATWDYVVPIKASTLTDGVGVRVVKCGYRIVSVVDEEIFLGSTC